MCCQNNSAAYRAVDDLKQQVAALQSEIQSKIETDLKLETTRKQVETLKAKLLTYELKNQLLNNKVIELEGRITAVQAESNTQETLVQGLQNRLNSMEAGKNHCIVHSKYLIYLKNT